MPTHTFTPSMQSRIQRTLNGDTDVDPTSVNISDTDVTLSVNTTGELSEIVDIRVPAGYVYAFPHDKPIQMYLMAHEQFTTDGSGGTDEQFTLSNDLVNSPTVADADTSQTSGGAEVASSGHADLVLYDEGTQNAMVSVDYDNNTFTYADAGTNSTLDVYYLWGDSSEIHARMYEEDFESYKQVMGATASQFHRANVFSDNERVSFRNRFALDSKERLRFFVDTSVDLTNWDDISASGPNSTSSYSFFSVPVYKLPKGGGGGPGRGRGRR